MADVRNSENGSIETRNSDSAPKFSSSGVLRPSAFAPANHQQGGGPDNIPAGEGASVVRNNPFSTPRMSDTSSRQEGGAGGASSTTPSRFMLRPSALDKQTSSWGKDVTGGGNAVTPFKSGSNSFRLEPAKLQSPFAFSRPAVITAPTTEKTVDDVSETKGVAAPPATPVKEGDTGGTPRGDGGAALAADVISDNPTLKSERSGAGAQPESSDDATAGSGATTVFGENLEKRVVAIVAASDDPKDKMAAVASSQTEQFVFGSNCADRVVHATPLPPLHGGGPDHDSTLAASTPPGHAAPPASPASGEMGTDGSPVVGGALSSPRTPGAPAGGATAAALPSLAESAALQQARQSRPELKEVEVLTGEENESNVFQFNAKLYVFEKSTQSWHERGRGLLRLNDWPASDHRPFQSRIVMRTQGSLRVILNTTVWAGMLVERASPKSVQITAADGDDGIKIFLISANPNDTEQMFNAIHSRAQQLKAADTARHKAPPSHEGPPQDPPGGAEAAGRAGAPAPLPTTPSGIAGGHVGGSKRSCESEQGAGGSVEKKQRLDPDSRRYPGGGEESNDSSALDPETEASNEGFASSPTIQSSSSSEA